MKRLLPIFALLISSALAQTVSNPVFTPPTGTQFANGQIITITSSTSGATLCYTLDGSTPTASGGTCTHGTVLTNGGTVLISASKTAQVIGTKSGSTNSSVVAASYTVGGGVTSNIDDIPPTGSGSPAIGWATPPFLDPTCPGGFATSYPHTIQNAVPSVDGFSSLFTINGPPPESCVGWFYNAGPQDLATVITLDFRYQSGSTNATGNANEFDPYQYVKATSNPSCLPHNTDFYFGMQCVVSTGNLQIWDQGGTGWHNVSPSLSCASGFAPGSFHHIVVNDHWNCGDTSGTGGFPKQWYDSITIDGVTHTINTAYSSSGLPVTYGENTGVNFQLDIGSAGTSLSANLDEASIAFAAGGTLAAPVCTPGTGNYGGAQTVNCTLPGSSTGCYTTTGVAPTAPTPGTCGGGSSTYSGAITISSTKTLQILATEAGFTNSPVSPYSYVIAGSCNSIPVPVGNTGCYYASDTGSDTLDGTQETTSGSHGPWQHFPKMPGATGVPASVTIAPGNALIFKGGDTWHFGNSSLTPYVGPPGTNKIWDLSSIATTVTNPVYIGVDPTWFTGASWTRPIFNGDNLVTTALVSSCNVLDFHNLNPVFVGSNSNIILDNFEATGLCNAGTSGVSTGWVNQAGAHNVVKNWYFHGYTMTMTADDEQSAIQGTGGGNAWKGDLTNQCIFNVFDNSDGSLGATGTYPSGSATMEAIQNACGVVAFNVFNRVSNGLVSSTSSVHDNLFHDMYNPINNVHGNIWNVNNDGLTALGNQEFYNNVMYNINEGVGVWFQQNPAGYYFNNVSWNIANPANCLRVGGSNVTTLLPVTAMYIYDNTWDFPCTTRGTAPTPGGDPAQNGPVHYANNHLIGFGLTAIPAPGSGATTLTQCDSGATCTWTDDGGNLFQTESVANGQGYTPANQYAPTTGGSTIGTGLNFASLIPVFSPDNALGAGIASVTEQVGNGGKVVSYPANPARPRPSIAAWDRGAYEFQVTNCSFPNLCGPTSLLPFAIPPTAPNVSAGMGTIYTDPLSGNCGIRVTDPNFNPASSGNAANTYAVTNGGSMDDHWFNIGDFLTLVTNSGGVRFLVGSNFVSCTNWTLSRPYALSTSGCPWLGNCTLTGGWGFAGDVQFSNSDPCTLWTLNNSTMTSYTFGSDVVPQSNPCSGSISGPPAPVAGFNFIEGSGNCLPLDFGTPTWAEFHILAPGDAGFVGFFSSANYHNGSTTGQGSGFYAAVWEPSKGCLAYNTKTGAIVGDPGWTGGAGLTCTGSQCTGTATAPCGFTIHSGIAGSTAPNSVTNHIQVTYTTQISGTCPTNPQSFIWTLGTNVVYVSQVTQTGGHPTDGALGMINHSGNPPVGQFQYRLEPPAGPSGTPGPVLNLTGMPAACNSGTPFGGDEHSAWTTDNATDSNPFYFGWTPYSINTSTTGLLPYDAALTLCPWNLEVDFADINTDQLVHRQAFQFNSGFSANFDTQNGLFVTDGNFASFGSDWYQGLGTVGSGAGGAITSGPIWSKSLSTPNGYTITPKLVNNAGGFSFQNQGGTCVRGTVEPSPWNQTVTATQTDGTCVWTNVGDSGLLKEVSNTVNSSRADVFMVVMNPGGFVSGTGVVLNNVVIQNVTLP